MVKWQPFASLPEQAGYIRKLLYDINKIEKPQLSEDQLEDLNHLIIEAFENNEWIKLSYYHDGYIYVVEGTIHRIDPITYTVTIQNGEQLGQFGFSNIINIETT